MFRYLSLLATLSLGCITTLPTSVQAAHFRLQAYGLTNHAIEQFVLVRHHTQDIDAFMRQNSPKSQILSMYMDVPTPQGIL